MYEDKLKGQRRAAIAITIAIASRVSSAGVRGDFSSVANGFWWCGFEHSGGMHHHLRVHDVDHRRSTYAAAAIANEFRPRRDSERARSCRRPNVEWSTSSSSPRVASHVLRWPVKIREAQFAPRRWRRRGGTHHSRAQRDLAASLHISHSDSAADCALISALARGGHGTCKRADVAESMEGPDPCPSRATLFCASLLP